MSFHFHKENNVAGMNEIGTPTDRDLVFAAIGSERAYQIKRWGDRQQDGSFKEVPKSVCDFITYMQHYMNEATKAATTEAGPYPALEVLRKVTALGVACFEQHGIRSREEPDVINARDQLSAGPSPT